MAEILIFSQIHFNLSISFGLNRPIHPTYTTLLPNMMANTAEF